MALSAPFELRCEYYGTPLGIDVPQPRFSWMIAAEERGDAPSAWQVIVSSEEELCRREIGDYWDSGRRETLEGFGALYRGEPFLACHQYFWKVRWWNRNGEASPWSSTARFGTAFFDEKDRKGRWIGMKPDEESEIETAGPPAVYARREFELEEAAARATAYVCGLGLYEFRINGRKVGDAVLDPPRTDYHKVALYSVFDVKDLVAAKNAVGLILGNGRHMKQSGFDRPKATCRIEIEFPSAAHEIILTDETWHVANGPVRRNRLDHGETYDARLEMPGWDLPGYDDSSWTKAVALQGPPLSSRLIPPLLVYKRFRPASTSKPSSGILRFDFGQDLKGWMRLRASGPEGHEIRLGYARRLNEDGTLKRPPDDREVTDVIILNGDDKEAFEPRFTCHDFRYVEVSGFPGEPGPDAIEACSIRPDIEKTGRFSCSDDTLNGLHETLSRDLFREMPNMPADPRDQRGFLRNSFLAAEEFMFNFDMAAIYAKCLDDIRLSQKDDGSLPERVEAHEPGLYPADPVDGAAYAGLLWLHYRHYEDLRIFHKHYLSLKRYVEFLGSNAEHHIIRKLGRHGDALPGGNPASATAPLELTSTWAYYHDVLVFSRIALLLDRRDDASTSAKLAEDISQAFNNAFLERSGYKTIHVNPDDDSPGQTSNILPLSLNMVPAEMKGTVLESLCQSVAGTDYHLDGGLLGARYILDVLSENGRADTAFNLAGRELFAECGRGLDSWLFKTVAGLALLEPGWRKFRINPCSAVNAVASAGATLRTIRGPVRIHWEKRAEAEGDFILSASVPVGSQAEARLPLLWNHVRVLENQSLLWTEGQTKTDVPGVSGVRRDGNQLVVQIGSGTYEFVVKGL